MSEPERGEHLFNAKGCATCHVEMKVIPVDVRSNKYDEKFVKQLLADPGAMPKRHKAGVEMPNLNLKPGEIAALAAYLAGPNTTGTRTAHASSRFCPPCDTRLPPMNATSAAA